MSEKAEEKIPTWLCPDCKRVTCDCPGVPRTDGRCLGCGVQTRKLTGDTVTEAELYDLEQWWQDNPERAVNTLAAEVRRLTAENKRLLALVESSAADLARWQEELRNALNSYRSQTETAETEEEQR